MGANVRLERRNRVLVGCAEQVAVECATRPPPQGGFRWDAHRIALGRGGRRCKSRRSRVPAGLLSSRGPGPPEREGARDPQGHQAASGNRSRHTHPVLVRVPVLSGADHGGCCPGPPRREACDDRVAPGHAATPDRRVIVNDRAAPRGWPPQPGHGSVKHLPPPPGP